MAVADSLLLLLPPRTYPTGKCTLFRRHTVLPLRSLRALLVCHCIVPPPSRGIILPRPRYSMTHCGLRHPFWVKRSPQCVDMVAGLRPLPYAARLCMRSNGEQWPLHGATHSQIGMRCTAEGMTRRRPVCCPRPRMTLHTAMDNVAHDRGQRCTRPWTTHRVTSRDGYKP